MLIKRLMFVVFHFQGIVYFGKVFPVPQKQHLSNVTKKGFAAICKAFSNQIFRILYYSQ
jgi:hypothetical protein